MGKNRRYASGNAIKRGRVAKNSAPVGRVDERKRDAKEKTAQLGRGEVSMLMDLVQWKINVMESQAVYDRNAAMKQLIWRGILDNLRKLENGNGR